MRGTLSVMVGADPEDYATVQPVMEAYATTVTHVGPVGSGQLVKLVNQVLVVVNQLAASEALLLAQAAGLDLEKTLAAVGGGAASSWMLANRGPQMIRRDWRPGFTIDLQQKDLRLALEAAESLGVPLPTTALVHQLYARCNTAGWVARETMPWSRRSRPSPGSSSAPFGPMTGWVGMVHTT